MKNFKFIILSLVVFTGCDNQLDIEPQGLITNDLVVNDFETTDGILTGAYASLDGTWNTTDPWRGAASNWIYGEVASDNAYKGSDRNDQPQINDIEGYNVNPNGDFLDYKYTSVYTGVAKANNVIRAANDGFSKDVLTQAEYDQFIGQARFLRGHYHFEAKKMWNKISYIDENATETVLNTEDDSIWVNIEADFQAAIDLLEETSDDVGRVNSWVAKTYMAKAHMYQGDFTLAKSLLDEVIGSGIYDLNARFSDNFNEIFDNSQESVFAIQYVVGDGSPEDFNANWGDILNFPATGAAGAADCCGFFQPSQNLVNAFKTDENGLPLLDTFNDVDVLNEETQFNAYLEANDSDEGYDDTFVMDTGNLDPRLDRTVGRRGIDYNGFGVHPGRSWIKDMSNGGPYLPKKNHVQASQVGTSTSGAAWSANVNAINVNIIRFAEVLLWRAEIAASEGDLGTAAMYVDRVRLRAANTDDFVTLPGTTTPAANYVISQYGSFSSQEEAIRAVEHEQRIELAMEGHRFFELVRKGTAIDVLNEYIKGEEDTRSYLSDLIFDEVDQYYRFPQTAIDQSGGILTPN